MSHRYLVFVVRIVISCLMIRYRPACQKKKAREWEKPLNGSPCINEEAKLGSSRSVAKLNVHPVSVTAGTLSPRMSKHGPIPTEQLAAVKITGVHTHPRRTNGRSQVS